ncbi:MAG: TOBE domain-containing protein [bacterium]
MKTGARNDVIGRVTEIKKGGLMCKVVVEVPAHTMSSVMTIDSLLEMGLKEGDEVKVATKAVNVLLIRE